VSRSVKKGPFIEKSLYKKIVDMGKAGDRKMIKTLFPLFYNYP